MPVIWDDYPHFFGNIKNVQNHQPEKEDEELEKAEQFCGSWPMAHKRTQTPAPVFQEGHTEGCTNMILISFDDSLWVSFVRCLLPSCRDQGANNLDKEHEPFEKTGTQNEKKIVAQSYQCPRAKPKTPRNKVRAQGKPDISKVNDSDSMRQPSFCKVCRNILNIVKFAGLRLCG